MPRINVRLIKGVLDDEQNTQINPTLAGAMVAIERENMRTIAWVTIDDMESGDQGMGRNPVTAGNVVRLAPARQPAQPQAWTEPDQRQVGPFSLVTSYTGGDRWR